MNSLSPRDLELVALGAAMGSNCVPCIEYHIPESRNAGLTDEEIRAAIQHADKVRQVPARMTLEAARNKLGSAAGATGGAGASPTADCGTASEAGAEAATPSMDAMVGMMFRMMTSRCMQAPSGGARSTPEEGRAATRAPGEPCGCTSKGS